MVWPDAATLDTGTADVLNGGGRPTGNGTIVAEKQKAFAAKWRPWRGYITAAPNK